MRRLARYVPPVVLALAAVPVLAPPAAAHAERGSTGPSVQVVASHLDNPRGLAYRHGAVWVAENGHGGSTCLDKQTCVGLTGALSVVRLHGGSVHRVVTGLISIGDPTGSSFAGPAAVSVRGHRMYAIMAANTQSLPPSVPPAAQPLLDAAKAQLGQLLTFRGDGSFTAVAGVGDADFAWSKDHKALVPTQFPDSNPNGVLAGRRDQVWVVDAGANTLDLVDKQGVHVVTFFPAPAGSPTDAVPTCVAKGPDGALYVTELLGGDPAPGHARVWRVVPGQDPVVWAAGLTTVNGCGFGPDGSFYAVEFQVNGLESPNPAGDVVRIDRGGHQTHLAVGALSNPTGFAAAGHDVFVSNCSTTPATGSATCPDGGQVVRIHVDGKGHGHGNGDD